MGLSKPPQPPDIRTLTAIRGLAAWWVVLFHFREEIPRVLPSIGFSFIANGYLAVDLFFELSGFVIALNYAKDMRNLEFGSAKKFFGLRFARIYPLHIFMLLVFISIPTAIILFSAQKNLGNGYSASYFIMSLFLIQNWGIARSLQWNIPAWSISTESMAYIMFPFIVWTFFIIFRSTKIIVSTILLLLVALLIFSAISGSGLGGNINTFGIVRCIMEFSIGVALYFFWEKTTASRRWLARVAIVVALSCFAGYALLPLPDYTIIPLGFAALIFALTDDTNILSQWLNCRPLVFLGMCSYSTYMAHYYVKEIVKFTLVKQDASLIFPFLAYLSITLVLSVVLYQLIEIPGRTAVRRRIIRDSRGVSKTEPQMKAS